jgi:alkanesulfonate monooxygenase SsuD/methylene tetrahydromethanopterin reductase-like flavin-dependent oxidoreductase (luciferase family)
VRIARAAERAGIEAIIPVARWRSPSPSTEPAVHRSFEAFTWAAGISASTTTIQVFATSHITTAHPVIVAKQIATLDHISGGRFGLNVVAGWNADEFRMFDMTLSEHSDRSAIADEWMTFLHRIFTEQQPFDVVGRWFKSFDVVSQPLPVQQPGPVIMSAAFSPAGRAFAAKHAHLGFVIAPDRAEAKDAIAAVKARARDEYGRELKVFGAAHVLCESTEAAARRHYEHVVTECGDWPGARNALRLLTGHNQRPDAPGDLAASAIFGFFATPLIGTTEHIVDQIGSMVDDGFDGLALSWVDYERGLAQFQDELLPLLIDAGLRAADADAAI